MAKLKLNELNSIVNSIECMDKEAETQGLEPVISYAVRRHNETVAILDEVKAFLAENFPKFVEKANKREEWTARSSSYTEGKKNPYNCIVMFPYSDDKTMYWVDKTFEFLVDNKTGVVEDISTFYGKGDVNSYCSSLGWRFSSGRWHFNGCSIYEGGEDFVMRVSNENADQLKKNVDEDYAHAERIVELLPVMLKKIADSVRERLAKVNAIADELANAKTKTIQIKVVEE